MLFLINNYKIRQDMRWEECYDKKGGLKLKISEVLNLNKSQFELDFIDIDIENDIPLFIDPVYISKANTPMINKIFCCIKFTNSHKITPFRLLYHISVKMSHNFFTPIRTFRDLFSV